MRVEQRQADPVTVEAAAHGWHRVARHPSGIVVFAAESARRPAPRAASPVSRHWLRSKHA